MILTVKHFLFRKFGNDTSNIIWLIVLYLFQGIPVGLAFSTIPFLLHKSATYTQIDSVVSVRRQYLLAKVWSAVYLAVSKSEDRQSDSDVFSEVSSPTFAATNKKIEDHHTHDYQQQLAQHDAIEDRSDDVEDISSKMAPIQIYKSLWKIITLPHIQTLSILFLTCKIVFQSNDALSLRLLEKGMKKEDLASFSIIQFPCTLLFSLISSKMIKDKPLSLWTNAYLLGIIVVSLNMIALSNFQTGWFYYLLLLSISLFSSFVSTTMQVAQGSFFLKISDKAIGGTYLTLLNTDYFSKNICKIPNGETIKYKGISEQIIQQCRQLGGKLETVHDGYFIVTFALIIYGLFMYRVLQKKFVPIQQIKPVPIRDSMSTDNKEKQSEPQQQQPQQQDDKIGKVVNVSLTFVKHNNKYLLVQERDHSVFTTIQWFNPAGRVERGETFQAAALREAKEESGVDVKIDGIIKILNSPQFGSWPSRMLVYFMCSPVWSGGDYPPTKTTEDEHSLQSKWFTVEEIAQLDLRSQSVIEIIRYIESPDFKLYPADLICLEGKSWWETPNNPKTTSKPTLRKKFFG
ncbi:putative acetyl-CoA transporter [Heterostelium album PN500]|uniref:Putative acetyl-CoA transporter n=1 Tax=Heterostelium pallidum (strain ATCC 26659 / Pp 5 / PN500) TaxID=670386 RepID=D3BVM6_HETP5|nr:putative acetyl-CoA transporter [Heterostelium album PN500]EFA74529.1 putative acetyl-CoA transporter [Heterostelium album PN500]|eukprot:XP_020426663.1 putative acetyl-CoA transporter [Heterostelium album PN500]